MDKKGKNEAYERARKAREEESDSELYRDKYNSSNIPKPKVTKK